MHSHPFKRSAEAQMTHYIRLTQFQWVVLLYFCCSVNRQVHSTAVWGRKRAVQTETEQTKYKTDLWSSSVLYKALLWISESVCWSLFLESFHGWVLKLFGCFSGLIVFLCSHMVPTVNPSLLWDWSNRLQLLKQCWCFCRLFFTNWHLITLLCNI